MSQLSQFASEQQQHGAAFSWAEFFPTFLAATFENWQSEWFQLVFQAILLMGVKHLLFQVDAQDLERIERKIDDLRDAHGRSQKVPAESGEPGKRQAIDPG